MNTESDMTIIVIKMIDADGRDGLQIRKAHA